MTIYRTCFEEVLRLSWLVCPKMPSSLIKVQANYADMPITESMVIWGAALTISTVIAIYVLGIGSFRELLFDLTTVYCSWCLVPLQPHDCWTGNMALLVRTRIV